MLKQCCMRAAAVARLILRSACLVLVLIGSVSTAQGLNMNIFGAIANRLPDYTYSIPGMALYFADMTHTALGFKLREKVKFNPTDLDVDMTGKAVLVAGGNAGIGRAAAERLAKMGADVHLLCRSKEKGTKAVEEMKAATGNDRVHLHIVDLSSVQQVRAFASSFAAQQPRLDVLINNAAVMTGERSPTSENVDGALATNLLGFYTLTRGLTGLLEKSAPSRVVNVVSAGMYTRAFALRGLEEDLGTCDAASTPTPYDGAAAYALHHRCRVMLTQQWARDLQPQRVTVNCVHPGWVDTPGLQTAPPMQAFYNAMRKSLRTEAQGADTIVWLSAAKRVAEETGKYWFDRAARRTSLPLANTEPSAKDFTDLLAFCEKATASK